MSVEMMRKYVMEAYPGKAWEKRVKKMSESQVLAIYNRLRMEGKIKC